MKYKTAKFLKFKVSFQNFSEAIIVFWDVFVNKVYHFESNRKNPFILDCGSHIGLSVLYFKKVYPKANIIAFEPNPNTFKLLKQNVTQNNLKNVKLTNAALSNRKGKDTLFVGIKKKSPWTWGDAIVRNKWNKPEKSKRVEVKTVKLSEYIDKKVDFLKLDIEGAETRVLEEIEPRLSLIKKMVMEFHGSSTNKENSIDKILKILKNNDFRYTIKRVGTLIKTETIKKKGTHWLIISAERTK